MAPSYGDLAQTACDDFLATQNKPMPAAFTLNDIGYDMKEVALWMFEGAQAKVTITKAEEGHVTEIKGPGKITIELQRYGNAPDDEDKLVQPRDQNVQRRGINKKELLENTSNRAASDTKPKTEQTDDMDPTPDNLIRLFELYYRPGTDPKRKRAHMDERCPFLDNKPAKEIWILKKTSTMTGYVSVADI